MIESVAYEDIAVGDAASLQMTIEEDDVELFADVTGDINPVHLDEEYAATTPFGQRVAHGMLAASMISAVIGTRLPGPGAIYLGQELRFVAPVHFGDTLTATAEVLTRREDKPILELATTVTNQRGEAVIEGKAVIKCSA